MLKWFNRTEPDAEDMGLLLALLNAGAFRHWHCPMCGDPVYDGDPDAAGLSWDHFQGVLNQNFSYFGDSDIFTKQFIRACCDTCRCFPTRFFPGEAHDWPMDAD